MVLVRVPRAEMDGLTVGQAWRDEVTEDESEMFGLTDLRHRRLGCVCHRHGGQTKHAASVLVGLDRLQHLLGQDALALPVFWVLLWGVKAVSATEPSSQPLFGLLAAC